MKTRCSSSSLNDGDRRSIGAERLIGEEEDEKQVIPVAETDCIFCRIVRGEAPCHKVWEDEEHLAFLPLYPNTLGVTVVITKAHVPSDPFAIEDAALARLTVAAKRVAHLLRAAFADVGRVGLVYEGFGVDHVHAKLFPLHGTRMEEWRPILSKIDQTFDTYPGYILSHSAKRVPDEELELLAERIRGRCAEISPVVRSSRFFACCGG